MRIEHITTLDAPALADYARLTDVALRRVTEPAGGLYIAESITVIGRALRAGHRPRSVLTSERWLPELEALLGQIDVTVYVGEPGVLEDLTGFHLHRGALASMHRPEPLDPAMLLRDARRIVIVEDVMDHTNVGAIFRSVAGLGADAVLVTPRCADPLYRRSVRVSMGTVLQVPWTRLSEWDDAVPLLHDAGFTIAALALADDAVALRDFASTAPERVAIVVGSEGDGLSRAALDAADVVVTIPMGHGVDSLNVAAASAVALYALTT
ncbi:MAG: RNA methyltransferase [Microcella sp.]|uniref:TrmH family RNA methyltransferase n=1 Tax=Microcella sp. TaxID=1913979 RepID=UPI0024CC6521|nr:RNA methyltransferase [Microcella sp.]UYN84291.1 MAG: RNA methyltransferase [Microcella sp.]